MSLDSRFIIASDLQQYFVDKTTGEPLSAGTIKFYQDQARTIPKDVYILNGSPPYNTNSYTNIGNEITLSSVGTVSYNNNDVVLYYFPYEGDPDESNSTVELYYVVVESSGGIQQFTRQAWPNFSLTGADAVEDVANYIPNGQFLSHNDLPATDTLQVGEVRAGITTIAQGGWTFERPDSSTATDIITFDALGYQTAAPGNPPFAFHLKTESADSGDGYKDLRVKFRDVNKFASGSDEYTFGLSAINHAGGSVNVDLILIKNYGSGGSTQTETQLKTFTISGSYQTQFYAFSFGTNENKTIGDNSYSQLAIRFQLDSEQDISVTNLQLRPNAVSIDDYPPTTEAETLAEAVAGWMPVPNPDGSDLYLPLKLTAQGLMFDNAEIGDVVEESQYFLNYINSIHVTTNRLLADGKQYETNGYSPLGIPFSRLQANYWNANINCPIYGTGTNYFTGVFSGSGAELRITNNSAGAVTNAADGSSATGFTFATIHKPTTSYYAKAYLIASTQFYLQSVNMGAVTAATAQTSGFTISEVQVGSTLLPEISSITTVAASSLANPGGAGKYFNFNTYNSGDTPFYVWYQITNETDPAPMGRTAIKINLTSTDTAAIVAQKTREALNGWQLTTVTTTAASAITTGSYFTVNSTAEAYYVWFKKDGTGTDPAPADKMGIEVDILSGDTNTQVATKIQIAINQKYFAAPDYRGYLLRGWNNGSGNDPDAATRWSLVPGVIGDVMGTFQLSQNISHFHIANQNIAGASGGGDDFVTGGGQTSSEGGSEARPINQYVNYAIKY